MGQLKKFSTAEGNLLLTDERAWHILKFFLDGDLGLAPGTLTENDRSFAQALLVEAIDASYAMSWIETVFRSAMKPNASVKGIIKALVKKALKDWFKHATQNDLKDPKIYQSVRNQLKRNWRSAWVIREATGEDVY